MTDLSTVIVSYNTKDITVRCVEQLLSAASHSRLRHELIVVDNGSRDGSVKALRAIKPGEVDMKVLENRKNEGFGKANNRALRMAAGEFILFLNSDVMVEGLDIDVLIGLLRSRRDIGVLTVRVRREDGRIDPACHRGFPGLWNSFCYFSKLELLTAGIPVLNRIFGGYHLTYKGFETFHDIDSPTGAFYLTRTAIVKKIGGFDEDFFMYGEDLDLSYRIKQKGYRIVYDPAQTVLHLKYKSGLGNGNRPTRKDTRDYFYDAMSVFYRKHYARNYPGIVGNVVDMVIRFMKK